MYDLLDFPEEYKVGKELGKDWFLQHANLSPAEKKYIMAYAKRILILYDIRFQDKSEVPVLYTEMDFHEGAPFFLLNYLKAIASSIPYRALIVLRCRKRLKYFMYEAHSNKKNNRRLLIEQFYASPSYPFYSAGTDPSHRLLVHRLRDSIEVAENAEVLYDLWMEEIGDSAGGLLFAHYQTDDDMFYHDVID
ncbi:MAG: hypothetical protein IJQ42_07745 [Oscillospiraceae bacterium]|nr:hypothetical protein [Oscillospiraceae bacterium]